MASPTLAVARAVPVVPVRFVLPPVARQVLARASQAELHIVLDARLGSLPKNHDFQSHFGLGQCFGAPAPASQSRLWTHRSCWAASDSSVFGSFQSFLSALYIWSVLTSTWGIHMAAEALPKKMFLLRSCFEKDIKCRSTSNYKMFGTECSPHLLHKPLTWYQNYKICKITFLVTLPLCPTFLEMTANSCHISQDHTNKTWRQNRKHCGKSGSLCWFPSLFLLVSFPVFNSARARASKDLQATWIECTEGKLQVLQRQGRSMSSFKPHVFVEP